jgi:MFS family permease
VAAIEEHSKAASAARPAPKVVSPKAASKIPLRSILAIAGLGTTQIIGWGSAFTPLMVLGATFARDLDVPREIAFAGITVMLIISSQVAPFVGRAVSRRGARPVMMAGSAILGAAMVAMALCSGILTYMLAWVIIGIGMPMALNNTAMPGLVEIVGRNARRAITALTLLSGLTSTVFLPLIVLLDGRFGWRGAYLVFALLHFLVCLPVHAAVLARRGSVPSEPSTSAGKAPEGPASTFLQGSLPADKRWLAFAMIAVWSCTEGMLTWGLNMQIIDVMKGMGLTHAAAIGVWMFTGPCQASARLVDLVLGNRFHILTAALLAAALAPIGFVILIAAGMSVASAAAFCVCFGIAHGFYAIARNTLPLMLFGQREYALYMSRLSVPQNIVSAIAPVLFASILFRVGPEMAIWLAAVSALAGFVAVFVLVRHCRAAGVG